MKKVSVEGRVKSIFDLVKDSVLGNPFYESMGELETMRAANNALGDKFANLIEVLVKKDVLDLSDLQEMFGKWEGELSWVEE